MMTFVVAAVDDRQIKTGGRTIETRRRLGVAVCALRAAGFFGGAMAPSAGAEPYGSTAGTGTISHPCHALLRRSQSAGRSLRISFRRILFRRIRGCRTARRGRASHAKTAHPRLSGPS